MFKEYKEKITNFYPNHWQGYLKTMWVEAIINPSFMKKSLKWIEECIATKSAEELELLFIKRLNYITKQFTKTKIESNKEKIERLQRAFIYFNMMENFVEDNKFVQEVLYQIKIKNPNNYLEIIANMDKKQRSCKSLEESMRVKISEDVPEELRFYLLLKKWQDVMHFFYYEIAIDKNKFLENELLGNSIDKNEFINMMNMTDIRLKNYLRTKIISLKEIVLLLEIGCEKVVKELYGGKGYGLAVLRKLGYTVPNAFVIPADYEDLNNLKFIKSNKHYAVRSSANIEDGSSKSFAGMFSSFLDVKSNEIKNKIMLVRDSVKSDRVKTYMSSNNLKTDIHMAVIVQEFEKPSHAGVWFGTDIDKGVLEYVYGDGESLVSGHQTPTREVWKIKKVKNKLTYKNGSIGSSLIKLQKKIIEQYNVLPDIEWCIVNNQLKFLQFRPITTKISISLKEEQENNDNNMFVGIPCSPGKISGICQFLKSPQQYHDFDSGNILLAMYTDPDWLPAIEKSSGVVTAIGGFLCHTAIICRELGIPCVVGVGMDYLEKINNKKITLNGTTGEVKLEDKK